MRDIESPFELQWLDYGGYPQEWQEVDRIGQPLCCVGTTEISIYGPNGP